MGKELELYVHIPFCIRKCAYCDFLSAPSDEATQRSYMASLSQEIKYYGAYCRDREVSTIYIGGGTPSSIRAEYIGQMMEQLKDSFAIRPDAEISMECNPGTLSREKLAVYRESGINRLSIGLQSADDAELKELGRIHTYAQFLSGYGMARKAGFTNINVDLMSALPHQTTETYLKSLRRVLSLRPEHISAYSLIIEEGTEFYRRYRKDVEKRNLGQPTEILPDEETEYEIGEKTKELLSEKGYHHYEISNYAKKGYESRHNTGYWKRTEYLGMGLGASSLLHEVRYTNLRSLEQYMAQAAHIEPFGNGTSLHEAVQKLTRQEQMEEFMFLGLRMLDGIERREFEQSFGVPIEAVYADQIKKLTAQDLIEQREGSIRLTARGLDVSNYVLAEFLL